MSRARHAGWCAALGLLAIAVAGCSASDQPDAQPQINVVTVPPLQPCPATRPAHLPDVLGSTLVPGTPDAAFACRYEGLNDPHPNAMAQTAMITGTQLTKLVATLNSATPWPLGRYCPIDTGLYDVIEFGYSNTSPVDVQVSVTGCASASNGRRTVEADPGLIGQLTSMVGASPPPST